MKAKLMLIALAVGLFVAGEERATARYGDAYQPPAYNQYPAYSYGQGPTYTYGQGPVYVQRAEDDPAYQAGILFMSAVVYMLPSIVASFRRHVDVGGIALMNLFIGWTIVGWFIAFGWALDDPNKSAAKPPSPSPPRSSEPSVGVAHSEHGN